MECPICYNEKKEIYACEICNHVICMKCKKDWGRDCPFCRQLYSPGYEIQSPIEYVDTIDIQTNPVNTSCAVATGLTLLLFGVVGYIGFTY